MDVSPARAATVVALLLAAFFAPGCALAPQSNEYGDEAPSWEDRDRIQTSVMPYAWRTTGSGDALVEDVPVSFGEKGNADPSFGGHIEGYSERVGFFLDGFYTTIHDRDAGVEFDSRHFVLDFGAAMRVSGGDPWQGPGERPAVDLELDGLALVRGHFAKIEANPTGAFSATTDDASWFDFVVGMRGAVVLAGRLSLFGRIDGGGMAINQWQSWSYEAETGVKLRITKNLSAVAAYRWFGAHWEDGVPSEVVTPVGIDALDSNIDVRLQGPWVGIVLQF